MTRRVVIDCFPENIDRYGAGWALVGVDVFRATTTAVTAVETGRRCFPVATLDAAVELARRLPGAVLAGELGGTMPAGFEENNSPVAFHLRGDVERPVILLSTSGTRLISDRGPREAVYAACLRNATATAMHVAVRHRRVAVVGAGARGEFRDEDQLGCAWVAQALVDAGFTADDETMRLLTRWRGVPAERVAAGKSAAYLRRSGQTADLAFVLEHLDDLDCVAQLEHGELRPVASVARARECEPA